MTKVLPPVLGFNNNVRHRGRIFHIQTEDSGVKSPRIVTHLFADGGRIIKTTRTDYSEQLGGPQLANTVREMMKAQHKAMFTALREGALDALLESACGPLPLPASTPEAAGAAPLSGSEGPASGGPVSSAVLLAAVPVEREAPASQLPRAISNPSLRKLLPSVPPPTAEALERAVSALDPSQVTPLLRGPAKSEPTRPRKSNPTGRSLRTPLPLASAQPERTPVSRPASRYGSAPAKSSRSIFGDGVISEKSLDEVILSYLADDLDGSSE